MQYYVHEFRGRCEKVLKGHKKSVLCLAVLQNGILVSGSADQSIIFWDCQTSKPIRVLENAHADFVYCLCAISDHLFASGGFDHALKIWDTRAGAQLDSVQKHTGGVNALTLLSNGKLVCFPVPFSGAPVSFCVLILVIFFIVGEWWFRSQALCVGRFASKRVMQPGERS
jgi:hypothetical protein